MFAADHMFAAEYTSQMQACLYICGYATYVTADILLGLESI